MTAAEPILEVRGLTVTYGGGRGRPALTALDGVSLTVGTGETLSIVGESGSGKTTLGNAVLGLVKPSAGSIRFAGEDITSPSTRRRRQLTEDIQVVFQNPQASLNPVRTIGQTLEEPLLAHRRMNRAQRHAEIIAALQRVGLDHDAMTSHPAQFSGGQLQRIAIARALMLSPRLLVCDEAVSALDLSIQAQILNLLRRLQRELGLSYLFISHDLAVVRHVSDRVAVLYRGRMMEVGSVTDVCDHPAHPYTQALLAAAPVPDPVLQRERRTRHLDIDSGGATSLSPFRDRCPHVLQRCAQPLPVHHTQQGLVACHRYGELGQTELKDLPLRRKPQESSQLGPVPALAINDVPALRAPLRSGPPRRTAAR